MVDLSATREERRKKMRKLEQKSKILYGLERIRLDIYHLAIKEKSSELRAMEEKIKVIMDQFIDIVKI